VPSIEVDQVHRACLPAQRQLVPFGGARSFVVQPACGAPHRLGIVVGQPATLDGHVARYFELFGGAREVVVAHGIEALAARQDRRRSHVGAHVLRVVERHHPAEPVMAHVLVAHVVVLVPVLPVRPRPQVVAVAVRMDGVIRSQQTCQRAAHRGRIEHLADLRYVRQNVVARIAAPGQHGVDPVADPAVKGSRKIRLDLKISVDDEASHRGVVKETGLVHHGSVL